LVKICFKIPDSSPLKPSFFLLKATKERFGVPIKVLVILLRQDEQLSRGQHQAVKIPLKNQKTSSETNTAATNVFLPQMFNVPNCFAVCNRNTST